MLTFIANLTQYRHWAADPANAEAPLASGDFQVCWEASRAGRVVSNLWTYYSSAAAEANDAAAWEYCEAMAKELAGKVMQQDCDLIAQMRYDLFYPIRDALHSDAMVGRCLDELSPTEISCFGEMSEAYFWDPPNRPPDIFNAAVWWAAQKRGIAVHHLRLPLPNTQPKDPTQHPFTLLPSPLSRSFESTSYDYVAVCPANDYREQELLLASIKDSEVARWLVVSDPGIASGCALPQVSYQAIRDLPFEAGSTRSSILAVAEMGLPIPDALPKGLRDALSNPALVFLWRYFCRALEDGSRAHLMGQWLARASAPRLVFQGYDVWGTVRCFIAGLRRHGVHVLSNQHAGIGADNTRKRTLGLEIPTLCWGNHEVNELRRWRAATSIVSPVGTLRRDYAELKHEYVSHEPKEPLQNNRPKIVLLTSIVGDMGDPVADLSSHQRTWERILDWCDRRSDWDFVIKPHPRYDYSDLYEGWCGTSGRRANLSISRLSARDALRGATVAVLVNIASTVVADACFLQVPIFYLKEAVFSWASSTLDHGIATVHSVEELMDRVELLLDDHSVRNDMLERQARFLRNELRATGADAVALVRAEIERWATPKKDARVPDAPSRWILDLLHLAESTLRGALSKGEASLRFKELGVAGRAHSWTSEDLLPNRSVGDHLLRLPCRWPHFTIGAPTRSQVVCWIYRALPRALRPSLLRLRSILSETCHQDGGVRFCAGERSAYLWEAASQLMSPGRLFRKAS